MTRRERESKREEARPWLILEILSLTNWPAKKQAESLKPILEAR